MKTMNRILITTLLLALTASVALAQTAPPVLDPIGAQSTDENVNLSFAVSASDADGTTPTLTTSTLPTGASFTDNGDGTGSFSWTPDYTQAGSYDVTFYANDAVSADVDSELVVITVNNVNQAPVLDPIGSQSVAEGVLLSFTVTASDPDGTIPTLSTSALPTGASFTDNGDGTGSFSWTPDYTQAGSYDITFTANDGDLTDDELVTVTVTNTNQAPVLDPIGSQSVAEGVLLSFTVTASDPDGTIPTLTTSTLPTGASFTDNGDGTGSFSWTPDYTQAGSYDITFTANDGDLTDDELVTVTVTNTNQAPVLDPIGSQSVAEGVVLSFTVTASDPDGTIPSLSTSALPTGASFTDNGDGTGSFSWTPDYTQAGSYDITFTANDGDLTDDELVTVTVTNTNQAPVLDPIGSQSVAEGVVLSFTVTASDPDGTIPTLSTSALPTGASFTDNGDGTGSFSWTPDYTQSGSYDITFTANDGDLTDDELVTVTVTEAGNQAPILDPIGPQSVTEGNLLSFTVTASDPDGTIPNLFTSALPSGASFTDNGDGTGDFSWTPTYTQAGTYNVTFYADDGDIADVEAVEIVVVEAGNQAPVLDPIGDQSVTEGILLSFAVTASDPDGTIPTLSTSALPTGASFTDNGDGTGSFSWTPDYTQAGSYDITFTAGDGDLTDDELVTITVAEAGNQAPILDPIGPQSTTEDVLLTFSVSATDPDGTIPSLSTSTLPAGASFTDNGDGTGSFSWTPDYTQAGVYDITFTADDGAATDDEIVTITVNDAGNQTPVLDPIGDQSTTEGVLLSFSVSASDPDGVPPALLTSTLPAGATFIDNGDGTGDFAWTPDYTQSGVYDITFTADDGLATDDEVVTITVIEAGNQAPILDPIGPQSTTEGVELSFIVTAYDPDGTIPTLSAADLPSGASFTDNGDGTGDFAWTPDFTQSGLYDVTFYANDGALADLEIVTITVADVGNQAPILDPIGPQSTTEDVLLSFTVSATDPDGTIPSLSTSALPDGATFVDNGDGTGDFAWTPDFTQAGLYDITFTASDGTLTDEELVTITVADAGNQAPVLAPIGPQSGAEDVLLSFTVSATDPDGTIPSLIATDLPAGATFIDNGDGTGDFNWTPDFTQAGVYDVTFTASDGSLTDDEIVEITIADAGNQAPILAPIGAQSTTEGILLSFAVSATDPDGTFPALTTSTLPAGASFIDNGDGTGEFSWTPDYTQSGSYDVTFTASDGTLTDEELVTITVAEAGNQAPILDPIGPQSTTEDVLLSFTVSATDPDGTIPSLSTSALPTGATFVDNGDGTGSFNWTPDFTQSGIYDVTFSASDGALTDEEIVTITVVDAGNNDPVLAAIDDQETDENVPLSFSVSATDADGVTPILSTSPLPTGATFVDNGDGTGTFDWTPTYDDSGSYLVTFYATDGDVPSSVDSQQVTITVNNVNRDVVLAAIGDQSGAEGTLLSFTVTASDPDGDPPVLTSSTLPGTAAFIDNGDGTGDFSWTPTYDDSGSYVVTFYATDGAFPSSVDSETVTITIDNTNRLPELATIGAQSGEEEVPLTFGVSATDPDGEIPILSASPLPGTATFVDNGDGTGVFDWTPTTADSGTYLVTFYAADAAYPTDVDSEVVTIYITNANQPPVLAAIGDQETTEGVLLSVPVSASDPDGDFPILSTSALPAEAVFTDNGDGTGSLDWTPGYTQSGVYDVTFYAEDAAYPGVIDSETVVITVNEAGNQPPEFEGMATQNVAEGSELNVTITANDPDGDIPALSSGPLPEGATFTDNLDGTGAFVWTPDYWQAGTYSITIYADDGEFIDSLIFDVVVADAGNQPPSVDPIDPQTVVEGVNLNFTVTASDPDAVIPTLTSSTLPAGAVFTDNVDGTGTFDWTPDFTQAGSYDITFYADDGIAVDSQIANITVIDNVAPPVLAAIDDQSGFEGSAVSFAVSATDPDGQVPILSTSALPSGASFVDNGDGAGAFDWVPSFDQSGSYDITFYATDGEFTDSQQVAIIISEAGNQTPVIDPIADTTIEEGTTLVVPIVASDPDGTPVAISVSTTIPTARYSFVDNGDGTGSFTYTASYFDAGVDTVRIFASEIGGSLTGTETFVVTTTDVNQPPVFEDRGPYAMIIFDTLVVNLVVHDSTDPDSEAVVFLPTDGLPENASLVDNGDNTGTFTFAPVWGQDGTYDVTFWAVDQGNPPMSSSLTITIQVQNDNLPPEITQPDAQSVLEGSSLSFLITGSDPDGAVPPSLLVNVEIENATFVDSGNGVASYSFAPSYVQSGLYHVKFAATDGIDTTWTDPVLIQVIEAGNQTPYFDSLPPDSVVEGEVLTGVITGGDPDLDEVTFDLDSATIPNNFVLIDSGGGVASYEFAPDFEQSGFYEIGIIISDGEAADTGLLIITVIEAGNQLPVLDPIDDYTVDEAVNLNFTVTASDIDGPPPLLSTSSLPGAATFTDNGDGTGIFDWTPTYDDSGSYNITFYATDVDFPTEVDSQVVNITVNDINRAPWYLLPPSQAIQDTVSEGGTLTLEITAWDDDGSIPFIEAFLDGQDTLATNMSFTTIVDGTNRVGTLLFNPDFSQGNNNPTFYYVKFRVVDEFDPTLFRTSGTITFRVYPVNRPPYINFSDGPGPFTIAEGEMISFNVQALDPDGTTPTLRAEGLPDSNYTASQPQQNVIMFSFNPDFNQAGQYLISFIAEDDSLAADTQVVEINVTDAGNQAPVWDEILPDTITVYQDQLFDTTISAYDPEGQEITLTAEGVPTNASFSATGGVGAFSFSPDASQLGDVYEVLFIAADPTPLADTMIVNFSVSTFLRGDVDGSASYTINDIVFMAAYMFRGGPAPVPIDAADADASGQVDISDLAFMVNFMYHSGPRPPQ